jgi:hypothetical protein
MHGKTFGGIKWSHRPENHNRLAANRKEWARVTKAFRKLTGSLKRVEKTFAKFGEMVAALVPEVTK